MFVLHAGECAGMPVGIRAVEGVGHLGAHDLVPNNNNPCTTMTLLYHDIVHDM